VPIPSPIYSKSLASDAGGGVSGLLCQTQVDAHKRLRPPILLCMTLKTLDGVPNFWVVFQLVRERCLRTHPPGARTPKRSSASPKAQQFSVYNVALLLTPLCDLRNPYLSAQKSIRCLVSKVREWVWCLWRQGLENPLKIRR